MGTKMAVAFANLHLNGQNRRPDIETELYLTARWSPEDFFGCGRMLRCRCRPTALWPKAEVTRGEAARKNAFHAGHFKQLYQTGNRT